MGALLGAHLCPSFSWACTFALFLLNKGPHVTCNQGSSRQQQLVQADPLNLSQGPLFSESPVSYKQSSLLLLLP